MLGCDETATLVQRREEADGDRYLCLPLVGVSWVAKLVTALSTDGVKPANVLKVRIPEGVLPEGVRPSAGDYLVRGVLVCCDGPAELTGLEYFRVTAVGDNRRGNLKHWAVSGA